MNYLTDERRHALCAEYVLGTLHGSARLRFQQLLMQHPSLCQTLWQWEKSLNELGGALPEQMPDPRVWQQIQRRLGLQASSDKVVPITRRAESSQQPPNTWRWWTGIASAAALVLAVLLVWPQPAPLTMEPEQFAVVEGEKAQPLWLIELQENQLQVRATEKFNPQPGKDYELWLVAADGRPPVSLGLLPKQGSAQLARIPLMDKVDIAALAVSLEPLGGSPTGQPTTVLYTAELVTL